MSTWEKAEEGARQRLVCPLCGGRDFDPQQGRIDLRWGITSHKIVMIICRNCGLVLQFNSGRGSADNGVGVAQAC